MIVVTRLVGDRLDVVGIDRPQPAGLVSTSTTPSSRISASVLLPPVEHVEDVADVERLHADDLVALRALGMGSDG